MSDSFSAPVQAPITVAELIRASVTARTEREATDNIDAASIRMEELIESLVQELGEAAFINLARDLSRWVPPSPLPSYGPSLSLNSYGHALAPGSFRESGRFGQWDGTTRHQLYVPGVEYEQEEYTA
jgi:hypothetical protein